MSQNKRKYKTTTTSAENNLNFEEGQKSGFQKKAYEAAPHAGLFQQRGGLEQSQTHFPRDQSVPSVSTMPQSMLSSGVTHFYLRLTRKTLHLFTFIRWLKTPSQPVLSYFYSIISDFFSPLYYGLPYHTVSRIPSGSSPFLDTNSIVLAYHFILVCSFSHASPSVQKALERCFSKCWS